jgi:hypothetical protein
MKALFYVGRTSDCKRSVCLGGLAAMFRFDKDGNLCIQLSGGQEKEARHILYRMATIESEMKKVNE